MSMLFGRSRIVAVAAGAITVLSLTAASAVASPKARLSRDLSEALSTGDAAARDVILQADAATIDAVAARHGAVVKRRLATGAVLSVPEGKLSSLTSDASVDHLSGDLMVRSMMAVTDQSIAADQAWAGGFSASGVTGRGVGVAFIDSGCPTHQAVKSKMTACLDFTGPNGTGDDKLGHGTHIAGIIAGKDDGFSGVAPGASLVSLKVLEADGSGRTSSVISALDWVAANAKKYNIRVVNLSLGRPVTESYLDDPLDQAVERAYLAGVVVVASAGNYGRTTDGRMVFGGITSPGNSPLALTVGALDTKGTVARSDDSIADFSSRGPTLYDRIVKPDLSAPGRRIASLYAPGSTLAKKYPANLASGNGQNGLFTLSGTSMAAAVVSGAAALVLEANPQLNPLQVRIALQMSSTFLPDEGLAAAGAGSLNAAAAVKLAEAGPAIEGVAP